jgi:uncharacterized membrane protein
MNIYFRKYPIDIILCLIWSIIFIPILQIDLGDALSIILGAPIIAFIPGYVLISSLFPTKKTEHGLNLVERVSLGIGLSLVLVAIIGIGLNYTPFDIQPVSSSFALLLFIICVGNVAIYRWFKTSADDRFTISFDLSIKKPYEDKHEKVFFAIIVVLMIITLATFTYVVINQKPVKSYTEFYLLGPHGLTTNYPQELIKGENATVILGITNHEEKTINYSIDVWLLNQTTNNTNGTNITKTNNAYFLEKINITLPSSKSNDDLWKPQWSYNYTFSLNISGEELKLVFLLFTKPTKVYHTDRDYNNSIDQIINSAYQELYLNMKVI